ncbi:MAG: chromate resistance protein ChrB domain-containing protein, partial [Stellaceae bacterium]
ALHKIAEIVHDIDLKDGKFGRPEAPGIASLIDGIAVSTAEDERRMTRGGDLFDGLYANFNGERT